MQTSMAKKWAIHSPFLLTNNYEMAVLQIYSCSFPRSFGGPYAVPIQWITVHIFVPHSPSFCTRHTRKTIFLSSLHLKLGSFKSSKALAPNFYF